MIDEVFAGTTESLINLAEAAAGTMPTAERRMRPMRPGNPSRRRSERVSHATGRATST